MKYDLHIHTKCSDGKYDKLELLKYFNDNNFDIVAFTDHNYIDELNVSNINKAYKNKYNAEQKVDIIEAIEFDVVEHRFLHILGYGIKNKERILNLNSVVKEKNTEITKQIIDNIRYIYDIEIDTKKLIEVSEDGNINKRGITKWMIENGYATDYIEAGYLYTSKESPCYVKKYAPTIEEVIQVIKESGGYSIMAHPFSLKLSEEETKEYIYKLIDKGIQGIEINNLDKTTSDQVQFLKSIVKELSLYQTCGSDFHNETATPKLGLDDSDSDDFIRMLRR